MREGTIPLTADPGGSDQIAAWIRAARGGDLGAFDRIVVRYERRVLRIVLPIVGDAEDAREVAQEAFLRAYRSLARFREGEAFEPWLFRIAVNLACSQRRRRKPLFGLLQPAESLPERAGESEAADEGLLRAERSRILREALEELTPRERAAVVLRELEGMTTEEVAAVLGLDPVTVRRHVSLALDRLRRILRERHPDLLR